MHGLSGRFQYRRCVECDLVYQSPRPEGQELMRYYPEDYGPHRELASLPKRHLLSNLVNPHARLEAFLGHRLTASSRVLDVGCGRGDFLAGLREKVGCQCVGVDISPNAARIARKTYGLEVLVGEIFDVQLQDESFDLITMWSVLEHVPDPLAVIGRCKSLLRRGGVLAFYVPNFSSVNAALFRNRWYHLDAPRHLSIFSPRSARRLLDRAGMRLTRIDYDRSAWGLLGSLQYSVWPAGRALFSIPDSWLFRLLCLPASFGMGLFGLSDTITVYAESR